MHPHFSSSSILIALHWNGISQHCESGRELALLTPRGLHNQTAWIVFFLIFTLFSSTLVQYIAARYRLAQILGKGCCPDQKTFLAIWIANSSKICFTKVVLSLLSVTVEDVSDKLLFVPSSQLDTANPWKIMKITIRKMPLYFTMLAHVQRATLILYLFSNIRCFPLDKQTKHFWGKWIGFYLQQYS